MSQKAKRPASEKGRPPKVSLGRALSKLGYCSRSQAGELIGEGRVRVNGTVEANEARRVDPRGDRIEVDGRRIASEKKVYLVFNKPRGYVTTRSDEEGRPTVYDFLEDEGLPWVAPAGRLDKASEGLLLFTNDTQWASGILSPESGVEKVYHVQIEGIADAVLLKRMKDGVTDAAGEILRAKDAAPLREGKRNSWLEVVLKEGKNRHIRRLLASLGVNVLRLVRVAIGPLSLGSLKKGEVRRLTREEVDSLGGGLTPRASSQGRDGPGRGSNWPRTKSR